MAYIMRIGDMNTRIVLINLQKDNGIIMADIMMTRIDDMKRQITSIDLQRYGQQSVR
jgi:hypothetical protein